MNVRKRLGCPVALGEVAVSLRARLAAFRLDCELAAGADPVSSEILRRRSLQLTRDAERRRLARALEKVVRLAHEPRIRRRVAVPIRHNHVRRCEDTLLNLAERLRDSRPVDAQGVAMAQLLVIDGRSPLYCEGASHSLVFSARRSLAALEPLGAWLDKIPTARP